MAKTRSQRQQRLEQAAIRATAESAAEAVLGRIPEARREYLDYLVGSAGGVSGARQWFRSEFEFARHHLGEKRLQEFMDALDLYEEAEVERQLILQPMTAASAAIEHAMKGGARRGH